MFKALRHIGQLRRGRVDFLSRIDDRSDWLALAARRGDFSVARTEIVKFVIDLRDGHRTYFQNTRKWLAHFDFVNCFIDPHVEYTRFNIKEYTREDRQFVMGMVVHYLDGDHWTVELDYANNLSADWTAWMVDHLAERIAVTTDLRYRPVTLAHAACIASLGDRLPTLSREAIDATVNYQPIVLGVAYGYLRLLRGALDISSVRPYDIVVIDHVPIQIPPVAALVTSDLQAPLAHVAVLSRNRNTPDMALRGAVDAEEFRRLEGELVKLTVAGQDYTLERADQNEAEAAWAATRPSTRFHLERDLTTTALLDAQSLPAGSARCVGAKAAQLADLCGIEEVVTPGGFVVPFAAYAAHLDAAGLTGQIDAMLADPAFRSDAAVRAKHLEHLRTAIVTHSVSSALLGEIAAKLSAISQGGAFIFRSSTNAEDLPGFNGAGLYSSIIVPAAPTSADIAQAICSVWASVWLPHAFEEREWFRIDHQTVAMAVLIQPFIERAVATGVAITKNPFRDLDAVFINSQVAGVTVTGALGNELPEQYLVHTWTDEYAPELISRSSLTNAELILREHEASDLTDLLLRIHKRMLPEHTDFANAMDVEFALTPERRFVILQARPHNVVYSLDRRPPQEDLDVFDRMLRRALRGIYRLAPCTKHVTHAKVIRSTQEAPYHAPERPNKATRW